jgi:Lantibiotic biosynthesis dehydratase C-term
MNRDGHIEWVEFSMHLPAGQAGQVLHDAIGPLLTAARRDGRRGLFLREPDGGERTRLIVQVEQPAGPAGSWDERLGGLGRWLGRAELAVRPAEYIPLSGSMFAGDELAPVTRAFLADATPTLLGLVQRDAANRAGLLSGALDLMAGHLRAVGRPADGAAVGRPADGGAPLSFLSFRSHAEAFLASSRDPSAARTALDRRYESVREAVEGRVRTILDELAGDSASPVPPSSPSSPAAHGWYHAVRAAKPTVTEHFRTGTLRLVPGPEPKSGGNASADFTDFAASPFHSVLAAAPELHRFLRDDPAFLSVRLLTSMLYLSLHSLGLSLVERYFLCHAVSRACESLFDVDAVEILSELAANQQYRVPAG